MGSTLAEFQSFTASFPPTLKGEAIASSDDIRKSHNAFSRKDAFLHESSLRLPTGDEDVFHFVRSAAFVVPIDCRFLRCAHDSMLLL